MSAQGQTRPSERFRCTSAQGPQAEFQAAQSGSVASKPSWLLVSDIARDSMRGEARGESWLLTLRADLALSETGEIMTASSCRVLMVYPSFHAESFWNYAEVCSLVGARYPAAPLGLITVAALLPKTWEVRLVDRNAGDLTEQDSLLGRRNHDRGDAEPAGRYLGGDQARPAPWQASRRRRSRRDLEPSYLLLGGFSSSR